MAAATLSLPSEFNASAFGSSFDFRSTSPSAHPSASQQRKPSPQISDMAWDQSRSGYNAPSHSNMDTAPQQLTSSRTFQSGLSAKAGSALAQQHGSPASMHSSPSLPSLSALPPHLSFPFMTPSPQLSPDDHQTAPSGHSHPTGMASAHPGHGGVPSYFGLLPTSAADIQATSLHAKQSPLLPVNGHASPASQPFRPLNHQSSPSMPNLPVGAAPVPSSSYNASATHQQQSTKLPEGAQMPPKSASFSVPNGLAFSDLAPVAYGTSLDCLVKNTD